MFLRCAAVLGHTHPNPTNRAVLKCVVNRVGTLNRKSKGSKVLMGVCSMPTDFHCARPVSLRSLAISTVLAHRCTAPPPSPFSDCTGKSGNSLKALRPASPAAVPPPTLQVCLQGCGHALQICTGLRRWLAASPSAGILVAYTQLCRTGRAVSLAT